MEGLFTSSPTLRRNGALAVVAVSGGRVVCLQSKVASCRRNEGASYHGGVQIMKYQPRLYIYIAIRVTGHGGL
jgi:hypothetical protein